VKTHLQLKINNNNKIIKTPWHFPVEIEKLTVNLGRSLGRISRIFCSLMFSREKQRAGIGFNKEYYTDPILRNLKIL
jgi:hypothetical protein